MSNVELKPKRVKNWNSWKINTGCISDVIIETRRIMSHIYVVDNKAGAKHFNNRRPAVITPSEWNKVSDLSLMNM